ncbi:MAG: helix-turn-helix domain-containing protein [Nocardioides sp.]|uniref:winged helix-turn-helix transcriptional regulator n=1 Tax=Nocardioides sp. TaxID=35761 RepID=UPI0039E571CD
MRTTMVRAAPDGCGDLTDEHAAAIKTVLTMVGDTWSLWVIRALRDGPLRYSDLHAAVPDVSQRMLTRTLTRLTKASLVARTSFPEVPPRVEYELTELGASLSPLVAPLIEWAAANAEHLRASPADRHQ